MYSAGLKAGLRVQDIERMTLNELGMYLDGVQERHTNELSQLRLILWSNLQPHSKKDTMRIVKKMVPIPGENADRKPLSKEAYLKALENMGHGVYHPKKQKQEVN